VVTGGLWSILGGALPQVQLLVLSIVAARFLGPDVLGLGDGVAGSLAAVLAGLMLFVLLAPVIRPLPSSDVAWLANALEGADPLRRTLVRIIRRLAPPVAPGEDA
jgi:hypothetical protein